MAYTKTTWVDGTTEITSVALNNLESQHELALVDARAASGNPLKAEIVNDKGAAGTAGRLVFDQADNRFYFDTGTEWKVAAVTDQGAWTDSQNPGTSPQNVSVPEGYHDGNGYVTVGSVGGNAEAQHVRDDKTFSSDEEGRAVGGTMPNIGQQTITPTTTQQTITEGYHDGTGYVEGDADLVAANIKRDANIFGVEGSFLGEQMTSSTTVRTSADAVVDVVYDSHAYGYKVKEIKVYRGGSVNLYCEWRSVDGTQTNSNFMVNGSYVGPGLGNSSTSWQDRNYTTDVCPGDLIQLNARTTQAGGEGQVRNFRLRYNYVLIEEDQILMD